jgi:uncharacterized protein YqjF (DUF2071 family)
MLNYAVDPALLQPYVPAGTELDHFEGRTYMSLIGFLFNRSRLLGIPAPFHQQFEEVNVRFYVQRAGRRGAVFIRELVPKRLVAAIARWAFNESYSRVPMSHKVEADARGLVTSAEYVWGAGPDRCRMYLETDGAPYLPAEGSASQFITEHYWGYAAQRDGGCVEYEVQHPQWRVWNAKHVSFAGNAEAFYGKELAQVLMRDPDSAFLAEGSAVTVFRGVRVIS